MDFGERLFMLRRSAKLSQEALAERLDISRQTVVKWESGKTQPTLSKLLELGKLFGMGLDELVTGETLAKEPPVPAGPQKRTLRQFFLQRPVLGYLLGMLACALLCGIFFFLSYLLSELF